MEKNLTILTLPSDKGGNGISEVAMSCQFSGTMPLCILDKKGEAGREESGDHDRGNCDVLYIVCI